MTIKQLSIFAENRSGALAEIALVLEKANIDIRALSMADTSNYGILRLIVDEPDAALRALRTAGFTVSLTEVLGVGVADEPGGLSKTLVALEQAGISVEYLYAFIGKSEATAEVILRVTDNPAAERVLSDAGICLLDPEELYNM